MTLRPLLLAALAGALVVGLLVTSTVAVVQARRVATEAARADDLAARVAELERQVDRLEAEGNSSDPLGGLLDGLLDGGTLDGLLGGGGDLDGLLDGLLSGITGEVPGVRCLTPEGGGGIGGLLDGGLGDLFGGGDEVPSDPDLLVETITDQVEQLRERTLDRDVDVAFLDDDELLADLERLLDEDVDPHELAAHTDVLVALRAIPEGSDLAAMQRELLEGQVAGYYATEEARLVVRTPEGEIRPLDRVTLAHELGHALVDQVVGLPDLEDVDTDAALAQLAVVEGDATLLMNLWTLEHLSLTDQLGMLGAGDLAGQQAQLEAFPHHLQRELIFPYTAGLDLICDRWLEGGWDAVDEAYAEPPLTSAGVLFPDRAADRPVAVPGLTPPPGGTARHDDTFGAAELLWLFEAPGGDTDAAIADPAASTAAWAGGEVRLWDVGGDPVVGLSLADRDAGDPPLCDSVTEWFTAAAPDATRSGSGSASGSGSSVEVRFVEAGSATVIRCDADGVRLAVAPSEAIATSVVGTRR